MTDRVLPPCPCGPLASRRRVLIGIGAVATLPLVGCDGGEAPIQFVDDETVTQMGLETWERMRRQMPQSGNAAYQQRLRRVGTRLVERTGGDPQAWEFRVFQGSEVNAFALPGRKVGVFEGMMQLAETDDQLAAVVAHEIAHVEEDHAQARTNTTILRDLGLEVSRLVLDVGEVQYAEEIAAIMGLGAEVGISLPYSRAHEREADRVGLALMGQAGYDPNAAVQLWDKMAQRGPDRITFLSTHPAAADRAERLREIIREQYGG